MGDYMPAGLTSRKVIQPSLRGVKSNSAVFSAITFVTSKSVMVWVKSM